MNAVAVPLAGATAREPGPEGTSGKSAVSAASAPAGMIDMPERAGTPATIAITELCAASDNVQMPVEMAISTVAGASAPTGKSAGRKRLEARLRGLVGKAIAHYRMIEDGDRVMACVSGGKDSFVMAHMLAALGAHHLKRSSRSTKCSSNPPSDAGCTNPMRARRDPGRPTRSIIR